MSVAATDPHENRLSAETASVPLVRADHLTCVFDVSQPWLERVLARAPKQMLTAVADLSFEIAPRETFALVGESGSGKSTVARMVVGLLRPTAGEVTIAGVSMSDPGDEVARAKLRRRIQMIFQDPFASLNPRWRVDRIIAEPVRAFGVATSDAEVEKRVNELLTLVRLDPADGRKYPHEFSGGQRQRIAIARALSANPDFIVCDEPTSALDVSVQAQIINLLLKLQRERGLTYLLISHDVALVRHFCDDVAVMYLGQIVESGPADAVLRDPRHPYTQTLLAAAPSFESPLPDIAQVRAGELPNNRNLPDGCFYKQRCDRVGGGCEVGQVLRRLSESARRVRCHLAQT